MKRYSLKLTHQFTQQFLCLHVIKLGMRHALQIMDSGDSGPQFRTYPSRHGYTLNIATWCRSPRDEALRRSKVNQHAAYPIILLTVVATAFALFAETAEARPIFDKGHLGRYQHDGRFLRRLPNQASDTRATKPKTITEARPQAPQTKHESGPWIRDGRRVIRNTKVAPVRSTPVQIPRKPIRRLIDRLFHVHRTPG